MSTAKTTKPVLTHEIDHKLGNVLGSSYSLAGSLQGLHLIREKIHARHYQTHDKEDITGELEQVNYQLQKLQSSLESLYHLLND